jgi:hypothetical protein
MNPTEPNQANPPIAVPTEPAPVMPAGLPRAASNRVVASLAHPGAPLPPPSQPLPQPPAAAATPGVMPAPIAAPIQPPPAAANAPLPTVGNMPSARANKEGDVGAARRHTANPNSTQNALQIAEIRDGIVIMNDGSFRAVVMVKSINFDLMSPQEQESVEYAYQGFLNSLYFPIQIFMRSQKVDLKPYIEKLDKIRTEHDNMLLALLMEDYITFIDGLSTQTNIMDKRFYVVVPFFPVLDVQKGIEQSKNFIKGVGGIFKPKEQHVVVNETDLENAKTELRNRVQAVLSGLLQCGVQGLPLDTQELIELYYDTYNPDTATRQELKDFGNLTADVITKGEGKAPQPHLQQELSK